MIRNALSVRATKCEQPNVFGHLSPTAVP
jgi:hypothetical protein